MDAMASMFARMVGMKPEDMQKLFTDMQAMVISTAEKVSEIHSTVKAINERLERMEANGNGDG